MCGVVGVMAMLAEETNEKAMVAADTYRGLLALQHRGEESAGISVGFQGLEGGPSQIQLHKKMGLVQEVFADYKFPGTSNTNSDSTSASASTPAYPISALGHVRYSTAGGSLLKNAQPFATQTRWGPIALVHNGNLVNCDVLKDMLQGLGVPFESGGDSEVILQLIVRYLGLGLERAVLEAAGAIKGSYALIVQSGDKILGLRDPHGIRPLVIGKTATSYCLASETCGLDGMGAEFVRDVSPGEMVVIHPTGIKSYRVGEGVRGASCSFEYIYFARPDSVIDGTSVYESRIKAGEVLFRDSPVAADLVVGVPDSGLPAAQGFANASGIALSMGFVKNKYVGRSFIRPDESHRHQVVSIKLNPLKHVIKNRRVVLVDDSIVRGTTIRRLVILLRNAGASEVHVRIASPIVKHSCYFGIDTPFRRDLIGAEKNLEEIRDLIGSDTLGYLSLKGLAQVVPGNFCDGCFSGQYPLAKTNALNSGDLHVES